MPSPTIITAMINIIRPVGQKHEIISPSPNAMAYRPKQLLRLFFTQPTALYLLPVKSYYIIYAEPVMCEYKIIFQQ